MSINLFQLPNYDLARGMEFVALWIMAVFVVMLIVTARAQYNLMNAYDTLNPFRHSHQERIVFILDYVKRLIFFVLGYKGEQRERQSLDELDEHWILENYGAIFRRFCIFYFIYIWALILTTRALLIDPVTGEIQVMIYTSKQIFGFAMILVYILSGSFFDIWSIYFTVKHLRKIKQSPRAFVALGYLVKNIAYSFAFFCCSQAISNLIWPIKTNVDVSLFNRIFSPGIVFWPYAFTVDSTSASPQYLHPIFPGQLLITGTVFLPTLVVPFLAVFLLILVNILALLKRYLIANDLTQFGVYVTPSLNGQEPTVQFRCINGFTIGVTASLVAAAIFKRLETIMSAF